MLEAIYKKHHKKMLWFTVIVFSLAILTLGAEILITGQTVEKDVSLSGGVAITVETATEYPISELEQQFDSDVRELSSQGRLVGYVISNTAQEEAEIDALTNQIKEFFQTENITTENTGSTLGERFFTQMIGAIFVALFLMAIVVYISFRKIVPSLTIMGAIVLDLLTTLAIFNLTGIKLSNAGIAAFLMIIGYAVDTNILLSSRVLKESDGSVFERIADAAKTGMTMTATTAVALLAGLLFTNSDVIFQIMLILFIGLLVDFLTTWFLNAGILSIYVRKQLGGKKREKSHH